MRNTAHTQLREEKPGFENPGVALAAMTCTPELSRRRTDKATCSDERDPVHTLIDPDNGDNKGTTITVYTLGRFSLLLDGKPAEYGRKLPGRQLELLKAIIAAGGRGVSTAALTSQLWPDADGDAAMRSFNTTLHRLRKMLGNTQAVILRDAEVSLDARFFRVDVWEFEKLLGMLHRIRIHDTEGKYTEVLKQLSDRLLGLYHDHFLTTDQINSWSLSMRERLRSKFIHALLGMGQYWEKHRHWDNAIQCYQKGLEVDDLIEVFYQRLMACFLETGRYSEGMAAYRRCRQLLSVVLGLQPEAGTRTLYESLKSARPAGLASC
jgi:two-component SAPR family response regulator